MEEIKEEKDKEIRKRNTITRPIELWIDEEDNEARKAVREMLWEWDKSNTEISNMVASHWYIQKNIDKMGYFSPEFKENNPHIFQEGPTDPDKKIEYERLKQKKDNGSITPEEEVSLKKLGKGWSPANRTYKEVSKIYKGSLPSDIYANINNRVISTLQKELKEYSRNERSLKTFKKGSPIPFSAKNIIKIQPTEDGENYHFSLFGIKFKTRFGRDKSGNKEMFDMCLGPDYKLFTGKFEDLPVGAYKFCDSSFRIIEGAKIFLLAVFQFETVKSDFKEGNVMEAHLSVTVPVSLKFKNKIFNIGDRQEFLYRRIAIQSSLRRQQIAARFNNGGNGDNEKHGTHRKKKMRTIEQFKEYESDFVISKHHKYTKKIIDFCIQYKCEQLILKYANETTCPKELTGKEKAKWHEENDFILRNWGYFGLTDKLKYKCKMVGIELIIEKKEAKAE